MPPLSLAAGRYSRIVVQSRHAPPPIYRPCADARTIAQQLVLGVAVLRAVRLPPLGAVGLCAAHHPLGRAGFVRYDPALRPLHAVRPQGRIAQTPELVRRHSRWRCAVSGRTIRPTLGAAALALLREFSPLICQTGSASHRGLALIVTLPADLMLADEQPVGAPGEPLSTTHSVPPCSLPSLVET